MKLITIIIPIFNEQDNIEKLALRIFESTSASTYQFEIIFINDGSTDQSIETITRLSDLDSRIKFIDFSRNFGQQSALRAGYDHARGDAVICMDADMQNPPELIPGMLERWEQGYDVVLCTRRGGQQSGGFFKTVTSRLFYRMMNYLSDLPMERNAPDFRLIDKKLVHIIQALPEREMFLRGIISWMGFKKTTIQYDHCARQAGSTSYNAFKMLRLAMSGITCFSVKPLHAAIYLGIGISLFSFFYIIYALIQHYLGNTISGWSSLIIAVSFLGGLQLFVLGIIGIYLGKLFLHAKSRPEYIVRDKSLMTETIENISIE